MIIKNIGGNEGWAFALGIFVFTSLPEERYKTAIGAGKSRSLLADHELGHGIVQSCLFGPLDMFLFEIPSYAWYWFNRSKKWKYDYELFYAESTASKWGTNWSKKIDTLK